MATDAVLTGEPEFRQCQAAKVLDCSPRTIQRESILGVFPKPDHQQWSRGRWVPLWKLSTLKAYRESKMKKES